MEPGVTKLIPKYLHGISRNSTGVAWHSWAYGNSAPSYARLGDSSSSLELIVEDMNGSAVVPLAHGPPGRPQLHAGRSIEPRRPRNGEFDVHSGANRRHCPEQDAAARNIDRGSLSSALDGVIFREEIVQFCLDWKAVTGTSLFRPVIVLERRRHNQASLGIGPNRICSSQDQLRKAGTDHAYSIAFWSTRGETPTLTPRI